MKIIFKRIIALMAVFVISFSFVVTPACAAETDGVTFWEYLSGLFAQQNLSSWWSNLVGSSDPATAESDYVTDLQTDMGTYTVTNGGLRLFFNATSFYNKSGTASLITGNPFQLQFTSSGYDNYAYLYFNPIIFPFSCTFDVGYAFSASTNVDVDSIYNCLNSGSAVLNESLPPFLSNHSYVIVNSVSNDSAATVLSGSFFVDVDPVSGTLSDATGIDVSSDTRVGSLAGDLMYLGDNGQQIVAENVSLFDESTSIINNPQTGTTATASSWVYDYATRTYTITATDGSTYVICMGDDLATQAVTDSSGTTITYNYYYGSGDSGSGGSNDGDSTWWEKILNKLSDGILAIFDLVGTIIGSIIGGLADLVTSTVTSLKNLVASMGQLPGAIGSLYTWLPPDLQSVIVAAFTVVVFAGLIKFFV